MDTACSEIQILFISFRSGMLLVLFLFRHIVVVGHFGVCADFDHGRVVVRVFLFVLLGAEVDDRVVTLKAQLFFLLRVLINGSADGIGKQEADGAPENTVPHAEEDVTRIVNKDVDAAHADKERNPDKPPLPFSVLVRPLLVAGAAGKNKSGCVAEGICRMTGREREGWLIRGLMAGALSGKLVCMLIEGPEGVIPQRNKRPRSLDNQFNAEIRDKPGNSHTENNTHTVFSGLLGNTENCRGREQNVKECISPEECHEPSKLVQRNGLNTGKEAVYSRIKTVERGVDSLVDQIKFPLSFTKNLVFILSDMEN